MECDIVKFSFPEFWDIIVISNGIHDTGYTTMRGS